MAPARPPSQSPTAPRLLILRPRAEGEAFAKIARAAGWQPVLLPAMRFKFIGRAAALNPKEFSALTIFTSPRGVAGFVRRLSPAARMRLRRLRPGAAAAGPATARAARAAGFRVAAAARDGGYAKLLLALGRRRADFQAPRTAITLVSPAHEGADLKPLRRLYPGARLVRQTVYASAPDSALRSANARLRAQPIRAIVAGSPRQWRFFSAALTPAWRKKMRESPVLAPGAATAAALRRAGVRAVHAVPDFTEQALRLALKRLAR